MNYITPDEVGFIIDMYAQNMKYHLSNFLSLPVMGHNEAAINHHLYLLKNDLENIEKWKRIKFGMIKDNKMAVIEFKDTPEQGNNDVYIPESPSLL
jgi:hypothetical protein